MTGDERWSREAEFVNQINFMCGHGGREEMKLKKWPIQHEEFVMSKCCQVVTQNEITARKLDFNKMLEAWVLQVVLVRKSQSFKLKREKSAGC